MATSISGFMKGRHGASIGAALLALGVSASFAPASAVPGALDAPTIEVKAAPKKVAPVAKHTPTKPRLTVSDKMEGVLEMADDFTKPSMDYGQVAAIAGTLPLAGFDRHLLNRSSGEDVVSPKSDGDRLMVSYETLVTVIHARDIAVTRLGQCSEVLMGAGMTLDAITEAVHKGRGWGRDRVNAIKIAAAGALDFNMDAPDTRQRWDFNNDEDTPLSQKAAFKPADRPAEPEKPEFAMGHLVDGGHLSRLDDPATALVNVNNQLDRALSELNVTHQVANDCAAAARQVVQAAYAIATTPKTDRKSVDKLLVAFENSLETVGVIQDPSAPSVRDNEVREVASPGWGPAR